MKTKLELSSQKPFIMKAYYDWFIDNNLALNVVLHARDMKCDVPKDLIDEDGTITLNITPELIWDFEFDGKNFSFYTKFNKKSRYISFPAELIMFMFVPQTKIIMEFPYDIDLEKFKLSEEEKEAELKNEKVVELKVDSAESSKLRDCSHLKVVH